MILTFTSSCERKNLEEYEKERKALKESIEKHREKIHHKLENGNIVFYSNGNYFALNINYIQLTELTDIEAPLDEVGRIMWEVEIKKEIISYHPDFIIYGKMLKEYKLRQAPKKPQKGKIYRLILINRSPYIPPLVYTFIY